MKVCYNINVFMAGTYEIDNETLELLAHHIGFAKKDIEETDKHSVNILFACNVMPSKMRDKIKAMFREESKIAFVDVMYRYEYSMIPDKFVVNRDGLVTEYTGHIEFTEDD